MILKVRFVFDRVFHTDLYNNVGYVMELKDLIGFEGSSCFR